MMVQPNYSFINLNHYQQNLWSSSKKCSPETEAEGSAQKVFGITKPI